MKEYLEQKLAEALQAFELEEEPEIQIEKPRIPDHGDASTNVAMMLAKPLRDNPRKIATRIKEALDLDPDRIEAVEIAGPGFINFRFSDRYLYGLLEEILEQPDHYGKSDSEAGKRVLVEFVSANPTGPLTVGHGRNAVLGDTIARMLEWTGAEVEREYYFNNAGRQMRLLGASIKARYLDLIDEEAELPEGGYEGSYIIDIARKLREEKGDELADEAPDGIFKEWGERLIFNDIEATLERMHISMDSFFNEHTLYENNAINDVVEKLRSKDLAYDHEGATWFKTTAFGKDKDKVLIKSSGEPTYRLPDIAYHIDKVERGYDVCIDIFGADHIDTIPDVISGVKALGHDASKIDVVIYQFVTLVKDGQPFKMSTRKANFVTLDELMDEVGADVTRFFFLMRSPNTHLDFDIGQAKEAGENNPVFYLQYAHARICSILRKAEEGDAAGKPDVTRLSHQAEIDLIKQMSHFPEAVHSAAGAREPHRIINYLNELASTFTSFYHECRILGEDPEIMNARTALARATAAVLANGLTILGITAPEQM